MPDTEEVAVVARCPLCAHKNREQLEQDLAKGDITKKAVSQELQMTVDQVHEHMMNHFGSAGGSIVKATAGDKGAIEKLKEMMNKKDLLLNSVVQLEQRLEVYYSKDQFTINETKQIVAMTAELRKTIIDLARVEGALAHESGITINMYNDLKTIVIGELCEDCKRKVLARLDKTEQETVETVQKNGIFVPELTKEESS